MDESHCIEPDVNTPEFSPKQIIALYLKFKPEAFYYVSTIYPWIIVFHVCMISNELYNSQCYNMV